MVCLTRDMLFVPVVLCWQTNMQRMYSRWRELSTEIFTEADYVAIRDCRQGVLHFLCHDIISSIYLTRL